MGLATIVIITSLVACNNKQSDEKESETTTEQEITYPTKEFVEGSIQIETTSYASREGWKSEQETTDIKEISESKKLNFSSDFGATVDVIENIYFGDTGLSLYNITLTLPDGNINKLTFEGPSGLHNSGEFAGELNNYFVIYSENKDKRMNIGIPDFRIMFMCTDDEYAEFSSNMIELKDTITDRDLLDLFNLPNATYITRTDEYIELVLENSDYKNIGYSCLKWYYSNPFYVVIDYYENAKTYDDDNAVLILDSLKWE